MGVSDAYTLSVGNGPWVNAPQGALANDSDANGDVLYAQRQSAPVTGTLNLAADGSFTYARPAGLVGVRTFTYVASDTVLASSPVTVTRTLLPADYRVYQPIFRR